MLHISNVEINNIYISVELFKVVHTSVKINLTHMYKVLFFLFRYHVTKLSTQISSKCAYKWSFIGLIGSKVYLVPQYLSCECYLRLLDLIIFIRKTAVLDLKSNCGIFYSFATLYIFKEFIITLLIKFTKCVKIFFFLY